MTIACNNGILSYTASLRGRDFLPSHSLRIKSGIKSLVLQILTAYICTACATFKSHKQETSLDCTVDPRGGKCYFIDMQEEAAFIAMH